MIEPGSWKRRSRWTRLAYGLLAVAALVLLALDRPNVRPDFLEALRLHSDDLAAPLMAGVSAPFSGMRGIRETLDAHWEVHGENDRLRARIAELEGWRELALSLRDKVSAYEAILGIPGVETADPIGAWTVGESGGPFLHARLMQAGADRGVRPGYPVLTDRGLIGRVVSVGRRSSRALLLTDANSRVPVMTEDGAVRAVLAGDNSGAPRLEFATGERRFVDGDRIVTSGDVGLFPRGLPIGVAARAGDDVWRVALYSSGQAFDAVWIYPHDPTPPPPLAADTLAAESLVEAPEAETPETAIPEIAPEIAPPETAPPVAETPEPVAVAADTAAQEDAPPVQRESPAPAPRAAPDASDSVIPDSVILGPRATDSAAADSVE